MLFPLPAVSMYGNARSHVSSVYGVKDGGIACSCCQKYFLPAPTQLLKKCVLQVFDLHVPSSNSVVDCVQIFILFYFISISCHSIKYVEKMGADNGKTGSSYTTDPFSTRIRQVPS